MKKELLITFLLLILPIASSLSCPYGEVDCEYPGDCARYTDTNNNNLCDYSENQNTNQPAKQIPSTRQLQTKTYNFIPLAIALIIIYTISHMLYKEKIITRKNHLRFWNILLTISFLAVGLSGLFLVIRINYGINLNLPFNLLYWHVETGIIMAMISIFHIIWHWPYYKCIFKKS